MVVESLPLAPFIRFPVLLFPSFASSAGTVPGRLNCNPPAHDPRLDTFRWRCCTFRRIFSNVRRVMGSIRSGVGPVGPCRVECGGALVYALQREI